MDNKKRPASPLTHITDEMLVAPYLLENSVRDLPDLIHQSDDDLVGTIRSADESRPKKLTQEVILEKNLF